MSRDTAGQGPERTHDPAVAEYFDREAPGWDGKYERSRWFRKRRVEIERTLSEHAGRCRTGLDYGCGSGALTDLVRAFADHTIATDVSPAMLARARERFAGDLGVTVVEPGAVELGMHDLVLCSSVVEYAEDDEAFLARLASFARDGGLVVISFPNRWGPLQVLNRRLARWNADSYVHRQRNVYTVGSVRRRLRRHGLVPVDVRASIGLPGLSALGLGDLIVAVARRTG